MYRISDELDLKEIIGSEIEQICSTRFGVQLHFSSGTSLSVQSDINLLDGDRIIGSWNQGENWSSVSFQRLLNIPVRKYSVPNNRLLQIELADGLVLQIYDSSDQYESFQITKKDTDEIIVV